MNKLEEINISEKLKDNLLKIGYKTLTSIQKKVIPEILEGRNIIGESRTGTGKTASFLIPIIEKIKSNNKTQALILAPTRELSLQISEEARKIASYMNISINAVYGGTSIERQITFLRKGTNIVIGTPGRIIDHLERKSLNLNDLFFFVLDEVDEMINKGFLDSVKKIMDFIPKKQQILVFSATITPEVKKFTEKLSNDFKLITAINQENDKEENENAKLIEQYYIKTHWKEKKNLLLELLNNNRKEEDLIIIFVNTKIEVENVKRFLSINGINAGSIHSNFSQFKRNKIIEIFKKGKIKILVATDVAARGIHINGISLVINYDLPQNLEFYIHRIGRTGRAGLKGKSITFVTNTFRFGDEKEKLLNLAKRHKYSVGPLN